MSALSCSYLVSIEVDVACVVDAPILDGLQDVAAVLEVMGLQ